MLVVLAFTAARLAAQSEGSVPVLASVDAVPQLGLDLPQPPDFEATKRLLEGAPRMLSYSVKSDDTGEWIKFSATCETAYPVSGTSLEAILQDYANAAKVFSRIDWVKIVDRLPNGVITEQFSGIKALGVKFYTKNRFHQWTSREAGYVNMNFYQIESGGTMRNCIGAWSVVDRSKPGEPLCYLHYDLSFDTLAQFPGQEAAMRGLGEADVLRVLKELGTAARERG